MVNGEKEPSPRRLTQNATNFKKINNKKKAYYLRNHMIKTSSIKKKVNDEHKTEVAGGQEGQFGQRHRQGEAHADRGNCVSEVVIARWLVGSQFITLILCFMI